MDIMKVFSNIIIGLIGTALTASVMWMVSEVSSLGEVKNEMKHMNKNITKLNETISDGNKRLETFNTYHTQNLSIISKAIAVNANEIKSVSKLCDRNEKDIEKCREIHMKDK